MIQYSYIPLISSQKTKSYIKFSKDTDSHFYLKMQDNSKFPIKTDELEVGDRIILVNHKENSYEKGEIRFKGPLKGNPDKVWFGIALDRAKGKHNGKGYFKTEENKGMFVTIKNLRKITTEVFDLDLFKAFHENSKKKKKKRSKKSKSKGGDSEASGDHEGSEKSHGKKKKKKKKKPKEAKLEVIKEEHDDEDDAKHADNDDKDKASTEEEKPKKKKKTKKRKSVSPTKARAKIAQALFSSSNMIGNILQKVNDDPESLKKIQNFDEELKEVANDAEVKIKNMKSQYLEKEKKTKKKIKALKKEIKELKQDHKKEVKQLKESQKRLKQDMEQAKITVDERELRIQELEYDMEIAILQAQIVTRQQDKPDALELKELKQNYEYLKAGFRILESRYERQKKAGSSYKDLQDKLWAAERENSHLKKQIDQLQENQAFVTSLSEKIIKKDRKIEDLEADNEKLEQQQEVSDDIISEFEDIVSAYEKVVKRLEKKNKNLTLSIEKLEFKMNESDKQLQDYRGKLKALEGEFDVANMNTENEDDKAHVKKIESLVKSYTECLKERNLMVHALTDWRIKDSKKIAERSRWSVIMGTVPPYLKKRVDDQYLKTFLELYEMSRETELILGIFRGLYLKSHFIIQDNIKLIDFIYTISKTLLDTLKICDFMFDYGFSMKNWEDFKSLMKSTFFTVATSTKIFLAKLVERIKEDKFDHKFSIKLLAGNNKKMSKICKTLTTEYKDVPNRKTIELRTSSIYIDIVYMYFCAYMMNQGSSNTDFIKQSNLLQEINKNVINDQSWANSQARLLKYKNVEKSMYKFNDFKRLKKLISGEKAKYKEAEEINFDELAKEILPEVKEFVAKYGISSERVDFSSTLYQLLATTGPWCQKIKAVQRELEDHNLLVHEKMKQEIKVKEMENEITRREGDRQSLLKTQGRLQERIQRLEAQSQKAMYLERENERFKVKEAYWEKTSTELKKEVANLKEERDKMTGSKFSLTQLKLHQAQKKSGDTSALKNPLLFRKLQSVTKKLGTVRFALKRSVTGEGGEEGPSRDQNSKLTYRAPQEYTMRDKFALISMQHQVKRCSSMMMEQKAKKTMDALQRTKRNMPRYQQYFSLREKKNQHRGQEGESENHNLVSDAKHTLTKLNGIRCAVRKAISSKKLIDLSAESVSTDDSESYPETSKSRLLRISAEIENQEDGLRTSIYRAGKELEDFKLRWAEDTFLSHSRTQIEGPHVTEALNKDVKQTKVGKLKIGDESVSAVFSSKTRLKKADHPICVKSEGLCLKSLISF